MPFRDPSNAENLPAGLAEGRRLVELVVADLQGAREEVQRLARGELGLIHAVSGLQARLDRMEQLMEQAGYRLRHADQHIAQLARQAQRDFLTDLWNRRALEGALEELLATGDGPVVLMLLDVDRFKDINDRHGHQGGDTVLRWVAGRLRAGLRDGDPVARWGGDEFAVVLRGLPWERAVRIARRSRVEGSLELGGGHVSVSTSAGVALRHPGESLASLVQRADQALYQAKCAGRDRLAFDPPLPPGAATGSEGAGVLVDG